MITYPDTLTELSIEERRILYYCAYTGKPVGEKNIGTVARLLECFETKVSKWRANLVAKGMLVQRRANYYESANIYISPYWHVLAICHLIQYDQPFLKKLNKVATSSSDLGIITMHLRSAMTDLISGNPARLSTSSPWHSESDYAEVLHPVAMHADFLDLVANLSNDTLIMLFSRILENSYQMAWLDIVGWVKGLYQQNPALKRTCPGLMGQAQFVHYLRHGEMCTDKEVMRMTSEVTQLQIEGYRTAYRGDLEGALKLLEASLKLNNKNMPTSMKNLYANPIATFLLFLVYAKDSSPASMKKLDQATRKKVLSEDHRFAPASILATYFKDTERLVNKYAIKCNLKYKDSPIPSTCEEQLTFLLSNYFGLKAKDLKDNYRERDVDATSYVPSLPLLKHELSPYLGLADSECERLNQIFGGKPLLHSIRMKEPWEVILENMLQQTEGNAKQGETGEANKKERIVYVFAQEKPYYGESIDLEVRLQSRLKNGEWGAGKKMSLSAYEDGNFEMDERDRTIWQNNQGNYYYPTLEAALPQLVGTTDKLLYDGRGYCRQEVTVNVVKPFLVVNRGKSDIRIESNLPKGLDLDNNVLYHFDVKNLVLTYYPLTAQQRQYFRQFQQLGKMPLEAEGLLKRVFPNINQMIEVHSDLIEGGTTLTEVDGQQKVCLRIVPSGGNFNMGVSVMPLEGGKQTFAPGTGNRIIYDERDGERCQVKRVLSQEANNGNLFMEFLESLGVDADQWSALLTAEDLLELLDFAREHPEEGYIEWPEGERVKLKVAETSTWNISLKKNGGWFDLEGEVPVDEHTVLKVGQLLEMMQGTRSRFVRVGEEQYLRLSESLRKQLQRIESLASLSRGKAHIPAVGMALMGEALKGELDIKHSKEVDEMTSRIRQSAQLYHEVPETLNATLRDYQVDGYQWMSRLDSWGAGACLADDMGLGKTIQTISFLLAKAAEGASLVVAPASVVPNWRKELARFAPKLNCYILNEADDRTALVSHVGAGDVLLSTYGLLVTQQEALVEKSWNAVCLDEAHTIKNRDTKTSAVCMKLQASHRIILTGTPIQNHLGELWNLFQFINPGLLGTYDNFNSKFITPIEVHGDGDRRQQLKRIIAPFMLRRTKQEVVAELPDKQEVTLNVELSREEMAAYEVLRRKAQQELEEIQLEGGSLNVNALAEITKLRMCSCSVGLVEKSWLGANSKVNSFLDLALEIAEGGNRALVFSQFTSFLEMVKHALDASPDHQNIKYFYLDGSTPMRKRQKMVEAFQRGECQLFLISLKAGGLGLNLTGANYVIHLDPWWNPAIEQQATDRAHRIGQQQKVTVYHLVSEHTIEEKILRLHETKRNLADSLLEGSNQSHKITAEELLSLLEV